MNIKLPLTLANRLDGIKNYYVGERKKKKKLLFVLVLVNLLCSRNLVQKPPSTHTWEDLKGSQRVEGKRNWKGLLKV